MIHFFILFIDNRYTAVNPAAKGPNTKLGYWQPKFTSVRKHNLSVKVEWKDGNYKEVNLINSAQVGLF